MKKINGKTIIGALLGAILGVVILVLLSGYLRVRGILNKSNYVEDSKVQIRLEVLEELDKQERQRRREQIEQQEGLDEEERQRLLEELDNEEELFVLSPGMEDLVDNQDQEELQEEMLEGTYSILLVGSDRQDHSWYGNSDGMILVTINHNVQKIFLMSFMRDLYANIPGIGVRKMNAAYAVGGGPLLLQTLQQNYGVSVSDYASVDFAAMEDLIDLFVPYDILHVFNSSKSIEFSFFRHGFIKNVSHFLQLKTSLIKEVIEFFIFFKNAHKSNSWRSVGGK